MRSTVLWCKENGEDDDDDDEHDKDDEEENEEFHGAMVVITKDECFVRQHSCRWDQIQRDASENAMASVIVYLDVFMYFSSNDLV